MKGSKGGFVTHEAATTYSDVFTALHDAMSVLYPSMTDIWWGTVERMREGA